MKRLDFIVGMLVRNGFRASLKGFDQFCRCLEMYSDNRSATLESIYNRIAHDCNCTKSSVEKNLRRLFASSDACTTISKLFGMKFVDTGNKEIIAMFSNYLTLTYDSYMQEKSATVSRAKTNIN